VRPFTKWSFDVFKNLIAATALVYFGKKTGIGRLEMLGHFAVILITVYAISYVQLWRLEFCFEKKHRYLSVLGGLLSAIIMLGVIQVGLSFINEIVADIARAQER
jgi:hypothetical protein